MPLLARPGPRVPPREERQQSRRNRAIAEQLGALRADVSNQWYDHRDDIQIVQALAYIREAVSDLQHSATRDERDEIVKELKGLRKAVKDCQHPKNFYAILNGTNVRDNHGNHIYLSLLQRAVVEWADQGNPKPWASSQAATVAPRVASVSSASDLKECLDKLKLATFDFDREQAVPVARAMN
ncbi:uncharacterized protein JCM15063_004137 [Sporobolomyces koalae]|uniref:uncharacterized protein n=1 Tax=Sporobolomyces koalae TaxID=500713 RepID=UPI00317FABFC